MNRVSEEQLKEAINGFQFEGNLISIKPYGSGHINDTYLLTYEIGKMGSIRVILQRVNQEIFTNPVELVQNIEGVTKVKALAANMLNIKPVLHGVDGEIQQLDQARGMNKALNKLLSHIEKEGYDNTKPVRITQCGSLDRCRNVRKILMERFGFTDVKILEAKGISSTYESRGGVIVCF